MTWHSITQRDTTMSKHTTYDEHGNIRFTDPDGETTLFVRGQGQYATGYSEPTTEPVGKATVISMAEFVGAVVMVLAMGALFAVMAWVGDFIGLVLAVLT